MGRRFVLFADNLGMNKWQIKQKSNVITNAQMTCAGISGAQGS
jgi:hypothetical protein